MKTSPIGSFYVSALFAGMVASFLLLVGCSNPVAHIPELKPEQIAARPAKPLPLESSYKMSAYDQITIRFTYHPEQDPKTPISIRPDGNITLDGVGSIRAAGLTPEELGKAIATKTSTRLKDPEVVVTVATFAPRRVYVGGEVKTPGIVQFQGEMTPLQAIFEKGGFTPTAQVDSVILIRDTGGSEPLIGRINANQSLEGGVPEKITLLTNDVIYVPMSGIGRADQWVKQHLRDIIPTEIFGIGAFGIR